ncbi:AEC family transporter [Actinotalea sp. BY-33]|uniref:AEC family transporter n=1 Tax=Actinotalea soli TaxID=2819234 RepID=A0A939LQD6_9CELL|nr:AEC family transporter [Actinotalea soli]MBO1752491.1 AEC family transporter [Actinotalea soli]
MAAIAVVGWLIGRARLLGAGAEQVLARTVFAIAAPSLLMVTIAHADLGLLLSRLAVVTAISTSVVVLIAALVVRFGFRRSAGETTVVTLAASYVNAGNLGIPIAVYLLGDAVAVVPTLLFQLLVLAPVAFAVLDARPGGTDTRTPADDGTAPVPALTRARGVAARTLRNPIIIGALTGVLLTLLPWDLPEVVYEPFRLIGAAAAPLALLTFGMSLAVPRKEAASAPARELALVIALRSVLHPALAAGLGLLLGLEGTALLAVVTMAALPTAQNVLVYALQYGRGQAVARDAGLWTTLLAMPVMLVIAAVLG